MSHNGGYGIFVSGRATIDRSTISGNLGDGVYGILCRCLIRTSTISGNAGTGLVSLNGLNGDLIRTVVRATTIAANGIGVELHPPSRVQSTIIADSTSGPDVSGSSGFTSQGYNLFEAVAASALIEATPRRT